jgi:hypothetical protein
VDTFGQIVLGLISFEQMQDVSLRMLLLVRSYYKYDDHLIHRRMPSWPAQRERALQAEPQLSSTSMEHTYLLACLLATAAASDVQITRRTGALRRDHLQRVWALCASYGGIACVFDDIFGCCNIFRFFFEGQNMHVSLNFLHMGTIFAPSHQP